MYFLLKLGVRNSKAYYVSSWEHSCELDVSTLRLLCARQEASLRTLFCTRNNSTIQNSGSIFGALHSLSVESMDLDSRSCWWEARMIIKNATTLNHLRLGSISRIAHDFALKRRPECDDMSVVFLRSIANNLVNLNLSDVRLSLRSMHLCALNLQIVLQGEMALDIDFTKITQLRLESCPELSQAFSILVNPAVPSSIALGALKDLFIRLEDPDAQFSNSLKSFLISIPGLIHLRVLIDNALADQDLEPILEIHGKTLRTLVWDERRGPRTRLDTCTSWLSTDLKTLKILSQKCRSLTTLGMALDWEAMSRPRRQVTKQSTMPNRYAESNRFQARLYSYLRNMPCLKALNIRNLPEIKGSPIMPMDYYAKGLAAMVVDIANTTRKSTLKTIAIGAPFFRDLYIGTLHVTHTPVSDLQLLRVYSIDYNYPSPSGPSPVLSQIIKGAAYITEDESYPKDLLYDYWLG